MKTKLVKIKISEQDFDLLSAIGDPSKVLAQLADHAAQGVRRPGAWEAGWIRHCFSDEFESRLEFDPVCHGQHWINYRTIGTKGQVRAKSEGENV